MQIKETVIANRWDKGRLFLKTVLAYAVSHKQEFAEEDNYTVILTVFQVFLKLEKRLNTASAITKPDSKVVRTDF